jgi:ABC-type Mn2+/Zn2+ transport system permease subunit
MNWLDSYLHRAIVEVVLTGGLGAVIGVHVVLRRLSFFTMAMTHATFPGVVAAAVLGFNIYLGGACAGLLIALAVTWAARRDGQDISTSTGVALSGGFALGVALLSAQQGFSRDLTAYLVGSVLTVSRPEVMVTAGIGALVVLALTALHKELVYGAFDPAGAQAAGYPAWALDLAVLVAIEAVIVTAVPAAGTILSVALIVAPAAAARLWTDSLPATFGIAAAIGAGAGLAGLALSERAGIAAGGAITLCAAAAFAASWLCAPRHGVLRAALRRAQA